MAHTAKKTRQTMQITSPIISMIFLPNLSINLPPNIALKVSKNPMIAVMI